MCRCVFQVEICGIRMLSLLLQQRRVKSISCVCVFHRDMMFIMDEVGKKCVAMRDVFAFAFAVPREEIRVLKKQ